MGAEYIFQADPDRDLIRITMSGFFETSDIEGFLEARRAAHRQLRCEPNQHLTINDLRGMKVQSQNSVEAFREVLAAPEYRSRRLAFVIGRTLAFSQLGRALAGRDAACFEDMVLAEAWLFGEWGAG